MSLCDELAAIVGPEHLLTDPATKTPFETDITRRWHGTAKAVVRPASVDEVASILRLCTRQSTPVVPQGGHTGLVGAGTPQDEEIVLSLTRLSQIGDIDSLRREIVVQAGTRLSRVQKAARAAGLDLPIDFGARDSATIGGMAATDAGGARAYRFGTMRDQVVGLEAILPSGERLDRLSGLRKDNAGFAIPPLLLGSEGTLCVFTRLRLRLVPLRRKQVALLCGLAGLEEALRLLEALQERFDELDAIDFLDRSSLDLVCARRNLPDPLPSLWPVYLVIALAGDSDLSERLADAFAASETDVVVGESADDRDRLWEYREALNESVNAVGIPLKIDIGLPIDKVTSFVPAVRSLADQAAPNANLFLWGHLGDGNVHVNLVGVAIEDFDSVEEAVLELAAHHGGTISAEHGVGQAKTKWLGLTRSPLEIRLMRDMKQVFDPRGILSPGRVLA